MQKNRSLLIDFFRGSALITIIFIHSLVPYLSQPDIHKWWNWAQYAVQIFVFCSAYVFFSHEITKKEKLFPYFIRRIKRLLLPYFIFLASFIFIFLLTTVFNLYLTARPIVIYNEALKTNLNLWTIPLEDYILGLSLISLNCILFTKLNNRDKHND